MADLTPNPAKLVLASGSPRRRELLDQLGIGFTVQPADIDESVREAEEPAAYVLRMAREKAAAGLAAADFSCVVLGADTTVVKEQNILGKPADKRDALAMLALLADGSHEVYSAVALTDGERHAEVVTITRVTFGPVPAPLAEAYWATGEPRDKAGGYAIQGLGANFVRSVHGSYTGVVGLPLFETGELLRSFGYRTGFRVATQ